jgi:IclR family transcriptional regulator, negative regulator of allantoin and glyoxylate utilization operons
MNNNVHHVPAVDRAIAAMQAIAAGQGSGNSSSLAKHLGISQASCYRILKTLEDADWIQRDEVHGYRLSTGLLPVVTPLMPMARIADAVSGILDDLARETQLTIKCCAQQGRQQVTIAAAQPRIPISILAPIGVPYPVVQAASGAALLYQVNDLDRLIAETPNEDWQHDNPDKLRERIAQCQRDGYCDNIGWHPQGIDAIAAPITGGGQPLALSCIGLHGSFATDRLKGLHHLLQQAVGKIEVLLPPLFEGSP